jgi:hypothetical protein
VSDMAGREVAAGLVSCSFHEWCTCTLLRSHVLLLVPVTYMLLVNKAVCGALASLHLPGCCCCYNNRRWARG